MSNKYTPGAFGNPKIKPIGEDIIILKRIKCYRCGRDSKFTKKNFPVPVVIDKIRVGYLCKVCRGKPSMRREVKKLS